MSHSRSNSLRSNLSFKSNKNGEVINSVDNVNKPDSPISPLTTRSSHNGGLTSTATTPTSSSSSSGSINNVPARRSVSGELSGSGDSSFRRGHARSSSSGSIPFMYSGTVNSTPANVLPTGNICPSGRILKTGMMANRVPKTEVLGSGGVNYGHGSIMRSGGSKRNDGVASLSSGGDSEELKRVGNESYMKGNFAEALSLYDKAIAISPGNSTFHYNRAAAFIGLKRLAEAVREFEDAIRLNPGYVRAHRRLGSLFISFGLVENARRHLQSPGPQADQLELRKLQAVEQHINKASDARRAHNWRSVVREIDAAISSGADSSPQLFSCRAEALLKLHQLDDAILSLSNVPKFEPNTESYTQSKFFGMLCEAYPLVVRCQVELAQGRFDNALVIVEKAAQIDPQCPEVSVLHKNVKLVARARTRGNDLFKSERFTEACSAYEEGLRIDPSNSVLYCNRAACWYKLGLWERAVDDCNQALRLHTNYPKALLRRAASYSKLQRWAEAVRDYEVLRKEIPNDNEISEQLFHAQVALKKSRGEELSNMKFGGEAEMVLGLEQFRAAVSSPIASVVHFKVASDAHCKQLSKVLDTLCARYPSINFLQVDVDQSPEIANAENIRTVPTVKIYKSCNRVTEMVCPSLEVLESSVRHYSV